MAELQIQLFTRWLVLPPLLLTLLVMTRESTVTGGSLFPGLVPCKHPSNGPQTSRHRTELKGLHTPRNPHTRVCCRATHP